MKRQIIFRGRTAQGNWAYGDLEYRRISHVALIHEYEEGTRAAYRQQVQVENKTIGQFTGLQDAYGKDIYEGDIVKTTMPPIETFEIGYEDSHIGAFSLCTKEGFAGIFGRDGYEPFYVEVIGNVHDNPELLKQ